MKDSRHPTKSKITDALARTISAGSTRLEIKDAIETGLSLRITPGGVRTFALKTRDASGRYRTITLGRYPELSVKEARARAQKARLDLKDGKDINAEKRSRRTAAGERHATVSLGQLVQEFETAFASVKKSWAPRGPRSRRSNARGCIETVFAGLLDKDVAGLALADFAKSMAGYKPARPTKEKTTSNGQVSRARAYLIPVLDWAAARGAFRQVGASRPETVAAPDLRGSFDPARHDPTILGERDRLLDERELAAILPLLVHPAPASLNLLAPREKDFRPVAMRFLLLTGARREEMVMMRRRDIDLEHRVWRKPEVKSTRGGRRGQVVPLSEAAARLLAALPHFEELGPSGLVFPNSEGGTLGNWDRFTKAIQKASGTADWHRHDLRRTAATLMRQLGASASVVDQILGHKNPIRAEQVSAAASSYIKLRKILHHLPDHQLLALEQLSEALDFIEGRSEAAARINSSEMISVAHRSELRLG